MTHKILGLGIRYGKPGLELPATPKLFTIWLLFAAETSFNLSLGLLQPNFSHRDQSKLSKFESISISLAVTGQGLRPDFIMLLNLGFPDPSILVTINTDCFLLF